MRTEYVLVNLYDEPIGPVFTSKADAEAATRAEWAKGFEVYVLIRKGSK